MGTEQFKAFGKMKLKAEITNYDVMGYTRVSSKEQVSNNSLNSQREIIQKFAKERNYNLVDMFGGIYESASGDLTRKEFMKLIEKVKSMKKNLTEF